MKNTDWLPGSRTEQLEMVRRWLDVLETKKTACLPQAGRIEN